MKENNGTIVTLRDVQVFAEGKNILNSVSATLSKEKRVVLFGPSGAGKSTLLKVIAGLIPVSQGEIDRNVSRISMIFQKPYLFEKLSGRENISYGLNKRFYCSDEIQKRTEEWIRFFSCEDFVDQKVSSLSGGEKQRIALARAFVKEPELVLMDESFSALDSSLRQILWRRVLELQSKYHYGLVYVTHSLFEALEIAEELWLLKEGNLYKIIDGENLKLLKEKCSFLTGQEEELYQAVWGKEKDQS